MRKSWFSEERIIAILCEQEAGARTEEVRRRHGVSSTTFYKWKARYGGLEVSDARRLKALEDENRRLKKLLAEAVLDVAALKDLLEKPELACSATRAGCAPPDGGTGPLSASRLRAARHRPEDVRRPERRGDEAVRERLRALAGEWRRFGYRRLGILLAREGMVMNDKKLYRLYREEGLAVRRRRGRKRATGTRAPAALPQAPNQRWSLDFVSDCLVARRFRILVVVDDFTRECLAAVADTSISGARVARELDALIAGRGRPNIHRQRQWPGTDLARDPGVDQPGRARLALHRAGQATAERLRRELHRPAAGRAPEPGDLRKPRSRPPVARALAARLQPSPAALGACRAAAGPGTAARRGCALSPRMSLPWASGASSSSRM